MNSQNQWLFELPASLEANHQEWFWEQDFAEDPPSKGKTAGTQRLAPFVLPLMVGVTGVEAAQSAGQQAQTPDKNVIDQTPSLPNPNASKALKAAAEAAAKRRWQEEEEKKKKKQGKTGGNPPLPQVKVQGPTFTGYPLPSVTPQTLAKNKAGFFTREAEANFLQETSSKQYQWLFEAPLALEIESREQLWLFEVPPTGKKSKGAQKTSKSSSTSSQSAASISKASKKSKGAESLTHEAVKKLRQRLRSVSTKLNNEKKKAQCGKPSANAQRCATLDKRLGVVNQILNDLNTMKTDKQLQHIYMTEQRIDRLIKDINLDIAGKAPRDQPSASLLAPKYDAMRSDLIAKAKADITSGKAEVLTGGGYQVFLGPFPDVTGWVKPRSVPAGVEEPPAQPVKRIRVIFDKKQNWHFHPWP